MIALFILAAAGAGFITGYCLGLRHKINSYAPFDHKLVRQTFIKKI